MKILCYGLGGYKVKKLEKIYQVEFIRYTNCSCDTVCNEATEIKDMQHIHFGKEPLLIKESDIDKYKIYGGGFRSLKFVGNIEVVV